MTKIQCGNLFIIGQDYNENKNGSEYIAILDENDNELIYWDKQEFKENPELVIGAFLGFLKNNSTKE